MSSNKYLDNIFAEHGFTIYEINPEPSADEDLHKAAIYGHVKKIKKLVEKGIYVDALDENDNTPLQKILRENRANTETVKTLIDLGAKVEGWGALGEAAFYGNEERVKLLLDHNPALIYEKDEYGDTAFDIAMNTFSVNFSLSRNGYDVEESTGDMLKTIKTLIQRGADASGYSEDWCDTPELAELVKNAGKIRANYLKKHPKKIASHKSRKQKDAKIKTYE